MELYEFKNLCMGMAELGAAYYAKRINPYKDSISQREAYKLFGEARIKHWVSQELISPVRYGNTSRSKKIYSLAELLTIEKAIKLQSVL